MPAAKPLEILGQMRGGRVSVEPRGTRRADRVDVAPLEASGSDDLGAQGFDDRAEVREIVADRRAAPFGVPAHDDDVAALALDAPQIASPKSAMDPPEAMRRVQPSGRALQEREARLDLERGEVGMRVAADEEGHAVAPAYPRCRIRRGGEPAGAHLDRPTAAGQVVARSIGS
jgi:hypothetical protein